MRLFSAFLLFIFSIGFLQAQQFTVTKLIPHSSIKDQGNSGTCWSFAATSFIESELIRIKGLEIDLSEMFTVRHIYKEKVVTHSRMQGYTFLSQGGQVQNVLLVMDKYGTLPEDIFSGKKINDGFDHAMLEYKITSLMKDQKRKYVDGVNPVMMSEIDSILNNYIGKPPEAFIYKYNEISPLYFRKNILGINSEDYIELTSYTHQTFYSGFTLKDKFNWAADTYYNLPLNEFIEVVDNALDNGYSVCWNGDVSESGFDFFFGTAEISDSTISLDQDVRQQQYDDQSTTVDHLMHIVGNAVNKDGKPYYYIKNSWGKGNVFNGYMYMSKDYFMLKTVSICVHKDAVPDMIMKKISSGRQK